VSTPIYDAFVNVPHPLAGSARILDFPCSDLSHPPNWVPGDVSFYLTCNWELRDVFHRGKPLVNGLLGSRSGQDLFEDILDSLRNDPDGPMVDVREDVVSCLGDRITIIGRSPTEETGADAFLFAIAISKQEKMRATLERIAARDADITTWQVHGHDVHVIGGAKYVALAEGQLFFTSNAGLMDQVLRASGSRPPRQQGFVERAADEHWQDVTRALGGNETALFGYGLPLFFLNMTAAYGSESAGTVWPPGTSRENATRYGETWFTLRPCPNGWCLQGTISPAK